MAEPGVLGVTSSAKTPSDFLASIKGKPVVVKLNSGVDYRGAGARCHGRVCLLCKAAVQHGSAHGVGLTVQAAVF